MFNQTTVYVFRMCVDYILVSNGFKVGFYNNMLIVCISLYTADYIYTYALTYIL